MGTTESRPYAVLDLPQQFKDVCESPSTTTGQRADAIAATRVVLQCYVKACEHLVTKGFEFPTNAMFLPSFKHGLVPNESGKLTPMQKKFQAEVSRTVSLIIMEQAHKQGTIQFLQTATNAPLPSHPAIRAVYLHEDVMYVLWASCDASKSYASLEKKGARSVAHCKLPMLYTPVITKASLFGSCVTAMACCPITSRTRVAPDSTTVMEYKRALAAALLSTDAPNAPCPEGWEVHLGLDGLLYSIGNYAFNVFGPILKFVCPDTLILRPEAAVAGNNYDTISQVADALHCALAAVPVNLTNEHLVQIMKGFGMPMRFLGIVMSRMSRYVGWKRGMQTIAVEMIARTFRTVMQHRCAEFVKASHAVLTQLELASLFEDNFKCLLSYTKFVAGRVHFVVDTIIPHMKSYFFFDEQMGFPDITDDFCFSVFTRCCQLNGLDTHNGHIIKIVPWVSIPFPSMTQRMEGMGKPLSPMREQVSHVLVNWRRLAQGVPHTTQSGPMGLLYTLTLISKGLDTDVAPEHTMPLRQMTATMPCDVMFKVHALMLMGKWAASKEGRDQNREIYREAYDIAKSMNRKGCGRGVLEVISSVQQTFGMLLESDNGPKSDRSPGNAILRESVATQQIIHGTSSAVVALRCMQIGDDLFARKHWYSAIEFFQLAHDIYAHLPKNFDDTISSESSLAIAMFNTATTEGMARGIAITKEVLDSLRQRENKMTEAVTRARFQNVVQKATAGRFANAVQKTVSATRKEKDTLPCPETPRARIGDTLNNLGSMHFRSGNNRKAIALFIEALNVIKDVVPLPAELSQTLTFNLHTAACIKIQRQTRVYFVRCKIVERHITKLDLGKFHTTARANFATQESDKRHATESLEVIQRITVIDTFLEMRYSQLWAWVWGVWVAMFRQEMEIRDPAPSWFPNRNPNDVDPPTRPTGPAPTRPPPTSPPPTGLPPTKPTGPAPTRPPPTRPPSTGPPPTRPTGPAPTTPWKAEVVERSVRSRLEVEEMEEREAFGRGLLVLGLGTIAKIRASAFVDESNPLCLLPQDPSPALPWFLNRNDVEELIARHEFDRVSLVTHEMEQRDFLGYACWRASVFAREDAARAAVKTSEAEEWVSMRMRRSSKAARLPAAHGRRANGGIPESPSTKTAEEGHDRRAQNTTSSAEPAVVASQLNAAAAKKEAKEVEELVSDRKNSGVGYLEERWGTQGPESLFDFCEFQISFSGSDGHVHWPSNELPSVISEVRTLSFTKGASHAENLSSLLSLLSEADRLEELSFEGSSVTDENVTFIVVAVMRSKTLRFISLRNNPLVGHSGGIALYRLACGVPTLTQIHLDGTSVWESQKAKIHWQLEHNLSCSI